jgi:hypothetical protein
MGAGVYLGYDGDGIATEKTGNGKKKISRG